ncbi:MAG: metallophosphoesterase [Desulfobulbaceae bacterium]|nr:metallophosphoesterase [Desulfobulbaceae bacterium]
MILFLLSFLFIYGSGHLYLLVKIKSACAPGRRTTWLLVLWSLLMVTAPILVHRLEHSGLEEPARLTALAGYIWMGWLFYYILLGLLFDVLSLLSRLAAKLFGFRNILRSSSRRIFLGTIILAAALVGYGFFEAQTIRLTKVVLPTDKLPQGITRLRVVQISDLHLGLLVGRDRLRTVAETIRQATPDIVVATGDLVDGQGDNLMALARQLREIPAAYGKFAILGNHELYAGTSHSQAFLQQAGFEVLRNETRSVAGQLVIAGMDDRRRGTWPIEGSDKEAQLLQGLGAKQSFILLLKHRPQIDPASLGHFDLQLSGHVHGGQLFPFGLLVGRFYPVPVGVLHPLAQGYIYVSRGAGTWGPPIRVLAPPEVTIIDLVPTTRTDR